MKDASKKDRTSGAAAGQLRERSFASAFPTLGVFVCFYFYVWLRVDPSLQFQAAGQEFTLGADFFKGFLARPGGMAEYVAALLGHFNQVAWLGALGLTISTAAIVWLTREILKRLAQRRSAIELPAPSRQPSAPSASDAKHGGRLRSGSANQPGKRIAREDWLRAICLGPAFFLLLLTNNYESGVWRIVVDLVAGLSFALGYISLPSQHGGLRFTVFAPGAVLLYWIAGAGPSLLLGGLGALFEFVSRRRLLSGAVSVCFAASVPVAAAVLFGHDLADSFKQWGTGPSFWLTLTLYLFFGLAALLGSDWTGRWRLAIGREVPSAHEPMRGTGLEPVSALMRKNDGLQTRPTSLKVHGLNAQDAVSQNSRLGSYFTLALFVLTIGLAFLNLDTNRKALAGIDYVAERGRWEEVLQRALHVRRPDLSSMLHVDRALFHSGRLADELFAFRQFKGPGLLPGLDQGLAHCRALCATLLELGQVNLAERFAHEALELENNRPAVLWQLARINILKDRPQAARIFLNVLRRIPFQQREADCWIRDLEVDPRLLQLEEIARVRPLMTTMDEPDGGLPTEILLEQLLQANRRNRMAFEYLMAHFLLTFQLDKLVQNLGRLDDFDYPAIPKHYEEAILLRQRFKGEAKIDLHGRKISPKTAENFERFQAQVDLFKNRRDAAREAMAGEFGNTFWYYFLFAPTSAPKSSGMQETEQ